MARRVIRTDARRDRAATGLQHGRERNAAFVVADGRRGELERAQDAEASPAERAACVVRERLHAKLEVAERPRLGRSVDAPKQERDASADFERSKRCPHEPGLDATIVELDAAGFDAPDAHVDVRANAPAIRLLFTGRDERRICRRANRTSNEHTEHIWTVARSNPDVRARECSALDACCEAKRLCYSIRMRPLILALISLMSLGCTSGPYAVTVRSARAPTCDAPIAALARSLPYSADYPIRVVRDAPLDGVESDARGRPVVPLQTMGRYRYLGEIESARARSYTSQAFASVLWMPEMHETTAPALRAMCWAQAPLRALTLGVWSVLAPTSWPCFALYDREDEMHVAELKRAAFAMGANTLLMKDQEDELVETRRTHRIVSTGTRSLVAYAFIDTWAAPGVVTLDDDDSARLSQISSRCWALPSAVSIVHRK